MVVNPARFICQCLDENSVDLAFTFKSEQSRMNSFDLRPKTYTYISSGEGWDNSTNTWSLNVEYCGVP